MRGRLLWPLLLLLSLLTLVLAPTTANALLLMAPRAACRAQDPSLFDLRRFQAYLEAMRAPALTQPYSFLTYEGKPYNSICSNILTLYHFLIE